MSEHPTQASPTSDRGDGRLADGQLADGQLADRVLVMSWRLRQTGLPFCLFGGAAGRLYGFARPARDVDFLVSGVDRSTLAWVFPEAEPTGRNGLALGEVELWCSPLSLRAGRRAHRFELDDAMCARRVGLERSAVPVMAPEDQLVMKAILQRRSSTKDDIADLRALLARWGPRLDFDYVDWRARRSDARSRVERGLRLAGRAS